MLILHHQHNRPGKGSAEQCWSFYTDARALCSTQPFYSEALKSFKALIWLCPAMIYLLTEKKKSVLSTLHISLYLRWEFGPFFLLSRDPADKIRDDTKPASFQKHCHKSYGTMSQNEHSRGKKIKEIRYSKANSTKGFHLPHFSSSPWKQNKNELRCHRCSLGRKHDSLKQKSQTFLFKSDSFYERAQRMNPPTSAENLTIKLGCVGFQQGARADESTFLTFTRELPLLQNKNRCSAVF